MKRSILRASAVAVVVATSLGCDDETTPVVETNVFARTDLVSDQPLTPNVDPELVNPWGLAFGPDTFFWVANNGTSTSTLYDAQGGIRSDAVGGPVLVPSTTEDGEAEGPTGVVFNPGAGFVIASGSASGPSRFVFATTAGRIVGWSPDVDVRRGVIAADQSANGASYTGLAIATRDTQMLLYAANFSGATIDVFDETFAPVELQGRFVDPTIPAGYAPFNVQEVGGRIYVAYAKQDEEGTEEVVGPGNGYVSAFDVSGNFIERVASAGLMNAPWGIARAPDDFGPFGGALLIGNFGDGRITAVDTTSHQVLGQLQDQGGSAVEIEGLWALAFGNGRMAGQTEDLYFTAGVDDEMHGVFGVITAVTTQQ